MQTHIFSKFQVLNIQCSYKKSQNSESTVRSTVVLRFDWSLPRNLSNPNLYKNLNCMRLNIFFSIYKSDCEYISVIKENIVKLYMYTFDSPAHVLISF